MERTKHVILDFIAIFTPALLVLASQLEELNSFRGVAWPTVAAAAVGSLVTWARTAPGGLRPAPPEFVPLNRFLDDKTGRAG